MTNYQEERAYYKEQLGRADYYRQYMVPSGALDAAKRAVGDCLRSIFLSLRDKEAEREQFKDVT